MASVSSLRWGVCVLATLVLNACNLLFGKSEKAEDKTEVFQLPYTPGSKPRWVYEGLLPVLDTPRVTISTGGLTARLSGLLPEHYRGQLPFYALTSPGPRGRVAVDVVYPISVGNKTLKRDTDGLPVVDAPPGTYTPVWAFPRYDPASSALPYGGFPALLYQVDLGLALHGPITRQGAFWMLKRGPISHGCNRMEGEHVVEMTHALGLNLKAPTRHSDSHRIATTVDVVKDFDIWQGRPVDVAYPKSPGTRATPPNAVVFPTWDGRKLPTFVCSKEDSGTLGTQVCPQLPLLTDPITGGKTPAPRVCPQGWRWESVGRGGICLNVATGEALGPFPAAMQKACQEKGGGQACLKSSKWSSKLAKSLYGPGICPLGSHLDWQTGYCMDGENAYGPFPPSLVQRCVNQGSSLATCQSARWNRKVLVNLIKSQ